MPAFYQPVFHWEMGIWDPYVVDYGLDLRVFIQSPVESEYLISLFLVVSRKDSSGLWSEPSYGRYWRLHDGYSSVQSLLLIALSNRQWTRWVPLLPLHDRKFPECFKSKRSFVDKNVPSALSGPPAFSLLSTISLKSPVKNQGSPDGGLRSEISFHTACLLDWSGPRTQRWNER